MTVLLGVAHGSKDDAAQDVVRDLLALAQSRRPGLQVEAAYIDNARPSIRAALARLAGGGATDVAVVPLLLSAASHSKTDVAASVQAARIAHPAMRIRYGRPFGRHPAVVSVLARRLEEAGAVAGEPVLLVAGGALDPDANAEVAATARLLWEGRDYASVDVAFASTTGPTVEEGLKRLRLLGFSRVAVARYFLAPGQLPRAVERAASASGLDIVLSQPLGSSDELAGLVLERYDEALTGDLRMNCDACMYRVPFAGRAHLVGGPQTPHTHPDEA